MCTVHTMYYIFNSHWNQKPSPACEILLHLFTLLLAYCGLQTTFQHGGLTELLSTFTSSCLTTFARHPRASSAPLQYCTRDHCCTTSSRKSVRCHPVSWISLHFQWGVSKSSNAFPPIWLTPLAVWQMHTKTSSKLIMAWEKGLVRGLVEGLASKWAARLWWNCCCVSVSLTGRALLLKRTAVKIKQEVETDVYIFMFYIPIGLLLWTAMHLLSKYTNVAFIRHKC